MAIIHRIEECERKIQLLLEEKEQLECWRRSTVKQYENGEGCKLCGAHYKEIQAHHILQAFNISIYREDLVIELCRECHSSIHGLYRENNFASSNSVEKNKAYDLVNELYNLKLAKRIVDKLVEKYPESPFAKEIQNEID